MAYPYGDVDGAVSDAAGALYEVGVTTRLAPLSRTDPPLRLPRLDAFYFRDSGYAGWGTARFERYLAFRRGLRRMRRVLTRGQP